MYQACGGVLRGSAPCSAVPVGGDLYAGYRPVLLGEFLGADHQIC